MRLVRKSRAQEIAAFDVQKTIFNSNALSVKTEEK